MIEFYEDMVSLSETPIRTRLKLTLRCYRYYGGNWNAMLRADQETADSLIQRTLSDPSVQRQLADNVLVNNALLDRLKQKGCLQITNEESAWDKAQKSI